MQTPNLEKQENDLDEIVDITKFQNTKLIKKTNWFNVNLLFFVSVLTITLSINAILLVLIF